jgi:hypothetical protein
MTETHTVDGNRLRLPETASTAEAAAIAAAVEAYARERTAAADAGGDQETDGWEGERFAFAGRLDGIGVRSGRVPLGAPTDRWTAAGRADRYQQ